MKASVSNYVGKTTPAYEVEIGPITVWFSYKTAVAFQVRTEDGILRVVRENVWGPTTGKHLNAIDGGKNSDRVDGATFERLMDEKIGAAFAQPV